MLANLGVLICCVEGRPAYEASTPMHSSAQDVRGGQKYLPSAFMKTGQQSVSGFVLCVELYNTCY